MTTNSNNDARVNSFNIPPEETDDVNERNITIRLHRWQPRTQKTQTQTITFDNDSPFDQIHFVLGRRGNDRKQVSAKQVAMRTHQVDDIVIGADGAIDIYTSPVTDRPYVEKEKPKSAMEMAGIVGEGEVNGEQVCIRCAHVAHDHDATTKRCMFPGCPCEQLENMSEVLARVAKIRADRGGIKIAAPAPAGPIDDSDIPF